MTRFTALNIMISIIVPVYNAERFLKSAVNSVLNSTYQDFELILVDDGSTDRSGSICDDYAAKDTRVIAIHKQNGGISSARNEGLKVSRGEFIGFMDNDDALHPQMLQILHDAIQSGDYDLAMSWASLVGEQAVLPHLADDKTAEHPTTSVLTQTDLMAGLFGQRGEDLQYMAVWNKLYRRELVEGLLFNKTASEDTEWNSRVFMRTSRAVLVDKGLYYWIQHPSSVSHAGVNSRYINFVNSYKMCLDNIPAGLVYRSWCLEKLYKAIARVKYYARHSDLASQATSVVSKVYQETIHEFRSSKLPWINRFSLLSFYHIPSLYGLVARGAAFAARIKG